MSPNLRALTFHQPWAWATANGLKTIDNRKWTPPRWLLGQYFCIHAGLTYAEEGHTFLTARGLAVPPQKELVYGAIVAVARLVEWVTKSSNPYFFGEGYVGWVLDPIYTVEKPIPISGMQGLWSVPEEVAQLVLAQTPIKEWKAKQLDLFGGQDG